MEEEEKIKKREKLNKPKMGVPYRHKAHVSVEAPRRT